MSDEDFDDVSGIDGAVVSMTPTTPQPPADSQPEDSGIWGGRPVDDDGYFDIPSFQPSFQPEQTRHEQPPLLTQPMVYAATIDALKQVDELSAISVQRFLDICGVATENIMDQIQNQLSGAQDGQ